MLDDAREEMSRITKLQQSTGIVERVPYRGGKVDSRFTPECATLRVGISRGPMLAEAEAKPHCEWIPVERLRPIFHTSVAYDEVERALMQMNKRVREPTFPDAASSRLLSSATTALSRGPALRSSVPIRSLPRLLCSATVPPRSPRCDGRFARSSQGFEKRKQKRDRQAPKEEGEIDEGSKRKRRPRIDVTEGKAVFIDEGIAAVSAADDVLSVYAPHLILGSVVS